MKKLLALIPIGKEEGIADGFDVPVDVLNEVARQCSRGSEARKPHWPDLKPETSNQENGPNPLGRPDWPSVIRMS